MEVATQLVNLGLDFSMCLTAAATINCTLQGPHCKANAKCMVEQWSSQKHHNAFEDQHAQWQHLVSLHVL